MRILPSPGDDKAAPVAAPPRAERLANARLKGKGSAVDLPAVY